LPLVDTKILPQQHPSTNALAGTLPLSSDIVMSYQAKMSRPWHKGDNMDKFNYLVRTFSRTKRKD
jgi:hypothetical protein